MSYDIGIGTCIAIQDRIVVVRLDRAMVPRLVPTELWARVPAHLWIARELCSSRRPLSVGQEVCLDSAAVGRAGSAQIDLGRGTRFTVELEALVRDMEPALAAPAASAPPLQSTPRVWQTPRTHYVAGGRSALSRFR